MTTHRDSASRGDAKLAVPGGALAPLRYPVALRCLPQIWSMATPCSPNAVCDPPSACSQPAWAAGAERGRASCPVPANRLRPQGHL